MLAKEGDVVKLEKTMGLFMLILNIVWPGIGTIAAGIVGN